MTACAKQPTTKRAQNKAGIPSRPPAESNR